MCALRSLKCLPQVAIGQTPLFDSSGNDEPWLGGGTEEIDSRRDLGKAGYGCHACVLAYGDDATLPLDMRGLLIEVFDGAGDGTVGYGIAPCGDCADCRSGYCIVGGWLGEKGWIKEGSVVAESANGRALSVKGRKKEKRLEDKETDKKKREEVRNSHWTE